MRPGAAAALLLFALASPGCLVPSVDDCGEAECSDMLTVTIERRDAEPFPPGGYDIAVQPAGAADLSAACDLAESGRMTCGGGGALDVSASDDLLEIDVRLRAAPAEVGVEIAFGDETLGDEVLVPSYQLFEPNGAECDPTCFQGSAAMSVISPLD